VTNDVRVGRREWVLEGFIDARRYVDRRALPNSLAIFTGGQAQPVFHLTRSRAGATRFSDCEHRRKWSRAPNDSFTCRTEGWSGTRSRAVREPLRVHATPSSGGMYSCASSCASGAGRGGSPLRLLALTNVKHVSWSIRHRHFSDEQMTGRSRPASRPTALW